MSVDVKILKIDIVLCGVILDVCSFLWDVGYWQEIVERVRLGNRTYRVLTCDESHYYEPNCL